jgi:hypothetical protein
VLGTAALASTNYVNRRCLLIPIVQSPSIVTTHKPSFRVFYNIFAEAFLIL